MLADKLLNRLDQALDSVLTEQCDRPERLVLAVWWLVDRHSNELHLPPHQAADQVQMMATLVAEQMCGQSPDLH